MSTEKRSKTKFKQRVWKRRGLKPADIDAVIESKAFHVLEPSMGTVCNITLKNGFRVRGFASCVSAENYNKELGEKISFENARKEIWQLEGYLLAEEIFRNQ